MHKYNFENATEKRQADKDLGFINSPPCDGQIKHPEHLQQHEMLQVLQREALSENWSVVRKMISELPEWQKKDTIEMLRRANNDPLIGKLNKGKFPDEFWFRKRGNEDPNIEERHYGREG